MAQVTEPVKPKTAFQQFSHEKMEEVKKRLPGKSGREVRRELSNLWQSFDKRMEYEAAAAQRKRKYYKDKAAYEEQRMSTVPGTSSSAVDPSASSTTVSSNQSCGAKMSKRGRMDDATHTVTGESDGMKSLPGTSASSQMSNGASVTETSCDANTPSASSTAAAAAAATGGSVDYQNDDVTMETENWTCVTCTFRNHPSLSVCEMCETSRLEFEKLKTELEEAKKKNLVALQVPHNWLPHDPSIKMRKVELEPEDPDYAMISQTLSESSFELYIKKAITSIVKIERIENYHLYQLYAIRKQHMDAENGVAVPNERMLWHGTDAESVENICINGFNRGHCGRNGTLYGKGVYFASNAGYSAHYAIKSLSKVRHMFLCRVLTGNFALGTPDMVEPPPLRKGESCNRYNSVVNDVNDPEIFVIFHDAQVYAEYLVSFLC